MNRGSAAADVAALSPDVHRYNEWVARAFSAVMPALSLFEVASIHSGLPVRTLDGRSVLGQTKAVEGFHIMSGDNEAGITHGPGLGQLLAE